MSKYLTFNVGELSGRYDTDIHGENIPAGAIEVTDAVYSKTITETDGVWSYENNKVVKKPFSAPPASTTVKTLDFLNSLSESDRIGLVELTMTDVEAKLWYDFSILSGIVQSDSSETVAVLNKLK